MTNRAYLIGLFAVIFIVSGTNAFAADDDQQRIIDRIFYSWIQNYYHSS